MSATSISTPGRASRNQTEYGRDAHAEAQLAQFAAGSAARRFIGNVDIADDSARLLVEHGACRSQRHAAPVADEQRAADLFFEILNALAQRRLRNVKTRSGAAKMELFGENRERS